MTCTRKDSYDLIKLITLLIVFMPFRNAEAFQSETTQQIAMAFDSVPEGISPYSPNPQKPVTLLFDYYHHSLPSTKVGKHIVTGSWVDVNGRYGWNDFVHTNTFDPVFVALANDFSLSMSRQPYSKSLLSKFEAVVIMNPDNPSIVPSAKLISDKEIALLHQYVLKGGSLMVMVNSGGPEREAEDFESTQLRKLVRGFGLDWNDDDTNYSDNLIPAGHPHFYDVPLFHYGAGCTLKILPEAPEPEVLLDVYSDSSYTDRNVHGHGIVMVRPGKGKFILVGDVGSWTGNMARPWADNGRILKQLFQYIKPSNGVVSPQLKEGKTWKYAVTVAGLEGVPVANSLSQISLPKYRMFSPRERTNMPYLEASANISLTSGEPTNTEAARMDAKVTDFKWFDETSENQGDQDILFTASKQGKVSDVKAIGYDAQWLAPEATALIALLPVDGVRPGDRWESDESLRIPLLRGTDLPPVKPYTMDITYVEDTEMAGKNCRLLRSSGEIWLDDLGVKVEELLPAEEVRRIGGPHYEYNAPHGGKLLFKREQWVDAKTGIVIKARVQTRIIAWIRDLDKPVFDSNADKDNNMIVSLAHIVNFNLE